MKIQPSEAACGKIIFDYETWKRLRYGTLHYRAFLLPTTFSPHPSVLPHPSCFTTLISHYLHLPPLPVILSFFYHQPLRTHTHRYTSLKKACSFSPGHQPNPQTHEGQRRPFTEQNAARGGGDKDSCGGNILLLFVLHNANRAASPCWRTDQEDVRSGGCEQRFL